MSKLLKVIVNTLLLLAILSAGALVIPPFAGITTLVSDGMGNTNISRGAVTAQVFPRSKSKEHLTE